MADWSDHRSGRRNDLDRIADELFVGEMIDVCFPPKADVGSFATMLHRFEFGSNLRNSASENRILSLRRGGKPI